MVILKYGGQLLGSGHGPNQKATSLRVWSLCIVCCLQTWNKRIVSRRLRFTTLGKWHWSCVCTGWLVLSTWWNSTSPGKQTSEHVFEGVCRIDKNEKGCPHQVREALRCGLVAWNERGAGEGKLSSESTSLCFLTAGATPVPAANFARMGCTL